MARPEMLSLEAHKNTRIITARGAAYGDNVHMVPVTARELPRLVVDFPVVMIKNNETGQFELTVLLGFEPGENLYLEDDKWTTRYIPLHLQRQPFMVGFQTRKGDDPGAKNAVMSLDMDSNRVSTTEGEPLFLEDGKKSPLLERMDGILSELMSGTELTKVFLAKILELELIEPAQMDVTFPSGKKMRYDGVYTVNAEKLAALEGEQLQELHKRGFLQACHIMMASLGQFNKLIARKK
ncbi:SapC family protein [Pseudomaricurvus alcaniphilus]|uniref:SapC family protein n=1 Tax=Pseudomaricurvus alcaniphilus TaxID=1166482 RepID=UPI00140BEC69|nr:SapC family protein [Pseudomaricurvus alcaniphilus]NHN38379.1 SapC family protein [Pseudomaricurvus alcaniphilus]